MLSEQVVWAVEKLLGLELVCCHSLLLDKAA